QVSAATLAAGVHGAVKGSTDLKTWEGLMKFRIGKLVYSILLFSLLVSSGKVFAYNEPAATKWYKKEYVFTQNWFTDRIIYWSELLKEFKGKPDVNYLEIGTFEGRSALWML